MKYLHVMAAGHRLLLPAAQVVQVIAPDAAAGSFAAGEATVLDLTAPRLGSGGGSAGVPVQIICASGTILAVDAVVGLLELADDALAPARWLPADAAALVDALTIEPVGGAHLWRLRLGLEPGARA